MPAYHYCPICCKVKIFRREVKTCGSPDCLRVWRQLSTEQRANLINRAADIEADEQNAYFQSITGIEDRQPERQPPPSFPTKKVVGGGNTVERDNQFLEKVFGDDAPGIVRDDKKDDDC